MKKGTNKRKYPNTVSLIKNISNIFILNLNNKEHKLHIGYLLLRFIRLFGFSTVVIIQCAS